MVFDRVFKLQDFIFFGLSLSNFSEVGALKLKFDFL
jgi:hypothetical protein